MTNNMLRCFGWFRAKALLCWCAAQLATGFLCPAQAQPAAVETPLSSTNGAASRLRPPVHPRRNVEDFPAVSAKFVRFRVFKTNVREPCVDELEIYPEGEPARNVALASTGARATASGSLAGYEIHQVQWVNDGLYGNNHSWIAEGLTNVWVQIELPEAMRVDRVVWGRDREGYLVDRLATEYCVEVSSNGNDWSPVASSADRRPLPAGGIFAGYGPGFRQALLRFAPISTTLPSADRKPWSEYRLDRWQTEDGLPGNEVTALLQTRDGYLWVGTSAGLARFDGVRFTRFGEREGVRSSSILCLFEDRAGTLWVGTDGGGLLRFENGRFQALTQREGLCSDVVMALAQDAEDRLWIGTYAGLDCWRDGHFVRDDSLPPRRSEPFSRVLSDTDGLWVVINGFLHQVKGRQYLRENPTTEPASEFATATLRRGPSGRLWFGGLSGRLNTASKGVLTRVPQPGKPSADTILDVCETRSGDLWLGMASTGLRRWRNSQVLSLTMQEGLADNSIRCLLEDREGNLWLGTSAGGLHRLKSKRVRLVTTGEGLSHNAIMSLAEDTEGNVWIGSNGGGLSVGHRRAAVSNPAADTAGTLARQQNLLTSMMGLDMEFAPADLSYLLDNESLPSVLAARDGVLWLGSWNGGLFRKTGTKLEQFNLARPDNDEPVLALCEGSAGGLWAGTYQDGLKFFKDGVFTSYRNTNGLQAGFITALTLDAEGRLWIGTGGEGLSCFFNGKFTRFTAQDGLAGDFIRTLYTDRQERLWIGMNGGLSRMKNGRITAITSRQGLWNDTISQILEDNQGRLWFGSNGGIFRVSKEELEKVADGASAMVTPVVYGKAEGMESVECTGGFCPAGLKTRDGRLWFSTAKGVVIVDPKNIPVNAVAPAVVIDELQVDGALVAADVNNPVPPDPKSAIRILEPKSRPLRSSEVAIGPGARRVEFRYSALSFTAPEKLRFRYQLDGLDSDWVEAGTRRVAEYPYLPPGHYQFRVTACNEDLVWSEREAVLALTCRPAFWQTGWFRLLATLVVLGAGGWTVKLVATRRLRSRLAVVQQQHALEQERTRIARDIHDELGTLLTGISLLSDRAQAHRERTEQVGEHLETISQRARSAVQTVDGIVWAINPQNDTLDNLANYLVQFAEDFFRLTPIRCQLDVPSDVPQIPLGTQQRHHILLAVKEACNNVARHSGAGEVWVRLGVNDSELCIAIEDNGRGFATGTAAEGSDGLRNMRQRMAEVGGRLELVSEQGQGTRVKLLAPLHPFKPFPCPSA
jgi:ligand-binding sensor domain-containing protein/signal transduction histidine kinase